jgi:hypothetical protein
VLYERRNKDLPFSLKKHQFFPILRIASGLTINHSQGQCFKNLGPVETFSLGQPVTYKMHIYEDFKSLD